MNIVTIVMVQIKGEAVAVMDLLLEILNRNGMLHQAAVPANAGSVSSEKAPFEARVIVIVPIPALLLFHIVVPPSPMAQADSRRSVLWLLILQIQIVKRSQTN